MKVITIKEVFENDNWEITELIPDILETLRVKAVNKQTNEVFNQLCGEKYVSILSRRYYKKYIKELKAYKA